MSAEEEIPDFSPSDVSDDEQPIPEKPKEKPLEKPLEKAQTISPFSERYTRLGVYKGESFYVKEQIKPIYSHAEQMLQNHSTYMINGDAMAVQLWKIYDNDTDCYK